jgi:hypothetical protein
MPEGGCLCDKVRIAYDTDPVGKALCHCYDCRKATGSTYSTNLIVPNEGFRVVAGSPKVLSTTANSGNTVNSYLCGECGTTLYKDTKSFGPNKVVKAGVLDDPSAINEARPVLEIFTSRRASWVSPIEGAAQHDRM